MRTLAARIADSPGNANLLIGVFDFLRRVNVSSSGMKKTAANQEIGVPGNYFLVGEKFRCESKAVYAAWVALKLMAEIADFGQIPISNTRPFDGEMWT